MRKAVGRLLAGMLVAASVVAVDVVPAHAVLVPRTLAASTALTGAGVVDLEFPADFIAVLWDGDASDGIVRFRHDGRWGRWRALGAVDAHAPGRWSSELIPAADAEAYQVRLRRSVRRPRAVAINTTDGALVAVRSAPSGAAGAAAHVIRRSEWGADERLRFRRGRESWPPSYHPAQKLTVHHTVTANGDVNPAATVRAIYRYHTIDRGWGDIGYQYLVDESGRVYEGRWSGTDGDPAHDPHGRVVQGAHVGGRNAGNVGVSLLGNFERRAPTAAAEDAVEEVLADLARRHGMDPQGSDTYVNPADGGRWKGPNIAGHRDWAPTGCPGGTLYGRLPDIRAAVAARLAATPPAAPEREPLPAPLPVPLPVPLPLGG